MNIVAKLKQFNHYLACREHAADMAFRAVCMAQLRAHFDIDRAEAQFADLMGRLGVRP